MRELERLRRKNDALKREIKYALQAVDYERDALRKALDDCKANLCSLQCAFEARGEAEILAAYARRRLKRAAQELAKEAQTK